MANSIDTMLFVDISASGKRMSGSKHPEAINRALRFMAVEDDTEDLDSRMLRYCHSLNLRGKAWVVVRQVLGAAIVKIMLFDMLAPSVFRIPEETRLIIPGSLLTPPGFSSHTVR